MNPGFRSTVAIVGIGCAPFSRMPLEGSLAAFANRSLAEALEDCGLDRNRIDGLLVHIGSPRGLDFDETAKLLALRPRFSSQTWAHGRFCGTVLQHAAMAIDHGLADYVVCMGVFSNRRFGNHGAASFPGYEENMREGGGPHAENLPAGLALPAGGAAMALRRYLHKYNIDRAKLASVPLAQRRAAQLNPLAVMQKPMTAEDYMSSPVIADPIRLFDCSSPVDCSVSVILTSAARARDCARKPVYLTAYQGMSAGPEEFVFGARGLGIAQLDEPGYVPLGKNEAVFGSAGCMPEDIDSLHCYDGFSPHVWWTLERFGFAPPGGAPDWTQNGRIEINGELPVNTSGGHLSEGHSNGWGHTVEIVRQLRGDAGQRQVANCRRAMWATTFGDAIIYSNERS
jgi:acetyl-CoA acetyltransferase